MKEFSLTVDVIADAISDAVAFDIKHKEHYIDLSVYENDLPSTEPERSKMLKSLINAVRRNIVEADIYLIDSTLYIKEL